MESKSSQSGSPVRDKEARHPSQATAPRNLNLPRISRASSDGPRPFFAAAPRGFLFGAFGSGSSKEPTEKVSVLQPQPIESTQDSPAPARTRAGFKKLASFLRPQKGAAPAPVHSSPLRSSTADPLPPPGPPSGGESPTLLPSPDDPSVSDHTLVDSDHAGSDLEHSSAGYLGPPEAAPSSHKRTGSHTSIESRSRESRELYRVSSDMQRAALYAQAVQAHVQAQATVASAPDPRTKLFSRTATYPLAATDPGHLSTIAPSPISIQIPTYPAATPPRPSVPGRASPQRTPSYSQPSSPAQASPTRTSKRSVPVPTPSDALAYSSATSLSTSADATSLSTTNSTSGDFQALDMLASSFLSGPQSPMGTHSYNLDAITSLSPAFFTALLGFATSDPQRPLWSAQHAYRAVAAYIQRHGPALGEREPEDMWRKVRFEDLTVEELEGAADLGAPIGSLIGVLLERVGVPTNPTMLPGTLANTQDSAYSDSEALDKSPPSLAARGRTPSTSSINNSSPATSVTLGPGHSRTTSTATTATFSAVGRSRSAGPGQGNRRKSVSWDPEPTVFFIPPNSPTGAISSGEDDE
ncbi:hypothetical protein HDU93_008022 [Gonapodya sp. JEL0774]|nr:hypothetical protein HDU93_008022 [Gonapodya sp. JEL0774]